MGKVLDFLIAVVTITGVAGGVVYLNDKYKPIDKSRKALKSKGR